MQRVDLMRGVEQDPVMMARVAGIAKHRPLRILDGELDLVMVFMLGGEPAVDVLCKAKLVERNASEAGFEFFFKGRAVKLVGVVFLRAGQRTFLNELALGVEQRGEGIVVRLHGFHFVLNAEEVADEVLKVGGDGDDQLRGRFGGEDGRIGARCKQTVAEGGVRGFQMFEELRIDAKQPLAMVKVFKFEVETQFKGKGRDRLSAYRHWLLRGQIVNF